ncbi:hypothetical protein DFH08DRAFT_903813 [Mycena albidolilacea]|uniref:Uncharacterized protein n=1 Tax=Mycena albidolilacea TaxID=1033008 RepID=A0AAD6Z246_9AGAR|nr:hypothetical protein DFH08DRAFT_903813 [Mycena albidolilacea]
MTDIFTAIEAVQGCVHAFHFNHHLVLPLRPSGALCPSILVMSRLAVESQTISIHGGTGGNGGAGGVSGGGGGEGEGPRTSLRYDITAESFTLTNNLASTTIEQPRSDFRSVNLGDLILYDEIDRQNVVDYLPIRRRRTGVVIRHIKVAIATQRVYRARVFGSQDPMTVVVHDDTKFEQANHQLNAYDSYLIFFFCRGRLKS